MPTERSFGLPSIVVPLTALLATGHATAGLRVTLRGGHLILARSDHTPDGRTLPDPRFRLTPLREPGQYGLSLYRRRRWEQLPYHGTLDDLVSAMNSDLQHWAADWP